jgi:hypothetical protein
MLGVYYKIQILQLVGLLALVAGIAYYHRNNIESELG